MHNIVYLDTKTNQVKTSTFDKFDKAHFLYNHKPPGAKILIELGIKELDKKVAVTPSDDNSLLYIVKQDPQAIIPKQNTKDSVGYDFHSLKDYKIPPQNVGLIDTGIAIKFPTGTYGHIASHSGLVINNYITVMGGVIDPDYTGNIKVLLYNFGKEDFNIKSNDCFAQIILEQYKTSPVQIVPQLPQTQRGPKGFGSTGVCQKQITIKSTGQTAYHSTNTTDSKHPTCNPAVIDMIMSEPLFTTTFTIPKTGTHPTLGLQFKNNNKGPRISQCIHGTPSAKSLNGVKSFVTL